MLNGIDLGSYSFNDQLGAIEQTRTVIGDLDPQVAF